MNIWSNSVITSKGLALQAKLIAGTKLTITRAVTGTAYVSPALLMQQTAVGGEMQELAFLPVTYPEEGKCVLPCRLTNEGLTAGYTAMQIGVYADDPDEGEILYFIAQSDSDKGTIIPSETEVIGYSAEWNFYFQYGQADEVSVTVDPSNTVSVAVLDEAVAKKADKNLSNVDDSTFFGKAQDTSIFTTGGTGEAYTVELPGVTELFPGLTFTMIPHVASTTTGPTLNVNSLGAVNLRQRLASTTGATTTGAIETWLSKGIPVTVTYNGTLWMVNQPRTSASYIYGTVDIEHGGTGADNAADARTNLGAAPAGYGLGGTSLNIVGDLDNEVATGWCAYGMNTANSPYTGYGVVEVIARVGGDTCLQRAHDLVTTSSGYYNFGVSAERVYRDDAWQPWEYVNPPMLAGVEYRTTERMNGKTVFKKRLESGVIQYRLDGETVWKDYAPVYGAAALIHDQAASTILGGTFGGQVIAKRDAQDPYSPLLRNSTVVPTERTPNYAGEINWVYE